MAQYAGPHDIPGAAAAEGGRFAVLVLATPAFDVLREFGCRAMARFLREGAGDVLQNRMVLSDGTARRCGATCSCAEPLPRLRPPN